MKKLLFLLTIIMLFQVPQEGVIHNNIDVQVIHHALAKQHLTMNEWKVVFLEEITNEESKHIQERLLEDHTRSIDENDQIKKYKYKKNTNMEPLTYELHLIKSKQINQKVQVQIIYKGKEWNAKTEEYYRNVSKQLQSDYKLKLTKSFTCAIVNDNGIMKDGFSMNGLMEDFYAIHKEEQTDQLENSIYDKIIYGYSPQLSNEININNEPINIQITLRNSTNEKKQLIIGTPLMLDEY